MNTEKNVLTAEYTKHEISIIDAVLWSRIKERQTVKAAGIKEKEIIENMQRRTVYTDQELDAYKFDQSELSKELKYLIYVLSAWNLHGK
jgi:protease II